MPLTLTLVAPSTIPIEVQGITPDQLREKTLREIQRLPVLHGNRQQELGELFAVTGSAADEQIEFVGECGTVHWIGAGMAAGYVRVTGSVGRHAGSGMSGGELLISGSAGDWAGAEMRRGLLRILGSAGDHAGGAYVGAQKGMTGGSLLIHGDAGNETGRVMRRGLIAVAGCCGDYAAFNMLAGSVMVFGAIGRRPGAGMRRGTLALLGSPPAVLLPTFRRAAALQSTTYRMMLRHLEQLQFPIEASLYGCVPEILRGDLAAGGKGEILRLSSEMFSWDLCVDA
jgi:formylmethanofuran dehydrogenase subunit C